MPLRAFCGGAWALWATSLCTLVKAAPDPRVVSPSSTVQTTDEPLTAGSGESAADPSAPRPAGEASGSKNQPDRTRSGERVAKTPDDSARGTPSEAADDDLEAELARELGALSQSSPATPAPAGTGGSATSVASSASAFGLSNTMNPAISANVTLLAGGTTRSTDPSGFLDEETGTLESGIRLQEAELRLSSIVDPYLRLDVTFSGNAEELGFEEAFVSTLQIPRLTLRAGQLFANFGRHNLLHTHAFPFLTAPLPWRALLGPEGLRGPGVSLDVLLPLPFFAEVNLQAFSADWAPFGPANDLRTPETEPPTDDRRSEDLNYLAHLKTLFDLDQSTTLEVGGSGVGGRNAYGKLTSVLGGDLTFKWRPVGAERYLGIDWAAEYLRVERRGLPDAGVRSGAYASLRLQFLRRWWVQGRVASLGLSKNENERTLRVESLLAFVPSEFSLLRVQYAYETGEPHGVHEVFLQASATIGPHPAHSY